MNRVVLFSLLVACAGASDVVAEDWEVTSGSVSVSLESGMTTYKAEITNIHYTTGSGEWRVTAKVVGGDPQQTIEKTDPPVISGSSVSSGFTSTTFTGLPPGSYTLTIELQKKTQAMPPMWTTQAQASETFEAGQ